MLMQWWHPILEDPLLFRDKDKEDEKLDRYKKPLLHFHLCGDAENFFKIID